MSPSDRGSKEKDAAAEVTGGAPASSNIAEVPDLSWREIVLSVEWAPAIVAGLQDADIVQILANPDGSLWFEHLSRGHEKSRIGLSPREIERVIQSFAGLFGVKLTSKMPLFATDVRRDGVRFEGALPPAVTAPAFAIRKRGETILDLADYVAAETLSQASADFLCDAVMHGRGILIAGAPGAGKTTLANALLAEIGSQADRVILIEEKVELRPHSDNQVPLRARLGSACLPALLRAACRLGPDRLVLDELRGTETLELLRAWRLHGGIATIVAPSVLAALRQLGDWLSETAVPRPRALVAESIQVVVLLVAKGDKRHVADLAVIRGTTFTGYRLEHIDCRGVAPDPVTRVLPD